jgi:hypothetical protein
MLPNDRQPHNCKLDLARQTLGEDAFAGVWADGRAMTMEQAAEYALKAGAGSLRVRSSTRPSWKIGSERKRSKYGR